VHDRGTRSIAERRQVVGNLATGGHPGILRSRNWARDRGSSDGGKLYGTSPDMYGAPHLAPTCPGAWGSVRLQPRAGGRRRRAGTRARASTAGPRPRLDVWPAAPSCRRAVAIAYGPGHSRSETKRNQTRTALHCYSRYSLTAGPRQVNAGLGCASVTARLVRFPARAWTVRPAPVAVVVFSSVNCEKSACSAGSVFFSFPDDQTRPRRAYRSS
jgi:hypothetical protein